MKYNIITILLIGVFACFLIYAFAQMDKCEKYCQNVYNGFDLECRTNSTVVCIDEEGRVHLDKLKDLE